jgi:hypothetical protein
LIGEDAPESLVDNYFNEDRVLEVLEEILEELPLPNDDLPRPANMDRYFRRLARAVHAVKVEDETAQVLIRQLRQENAGRLPQRSPSPPIAIEADDDDFYEDADSDDVPLDAARNDESDEIDELDPVNLPKHPDDLIDDEADEVPEGEEESSPAPSKEDASGSSSTDSEASGSEESDDASEGSGEELEDEGDAPPSPPISALVDYGSD